MITVIARWEESQLQPVNEFQLWRQVRGAFRVERLIFTPIMPNMEEYGFEQSATMEEALASVTGERVFLEPTGDKGMNDIPQGDIVLITGNTNYSNLNYAEAGEIYSIKTAASTHLYPSEAAAIALAIRYGQ